MRRAKGSLQRAAIARTAAGKRSKVRRHSLDRLHASMTKQNKKKVPSPPPTSAGGPLWPPPRLAFPADAQHYAPPQQYTAAKRGIHGGFVMLREASVGC